MPLVLNPETGSLVPPFSVVFDDWFATVASNINLVPDFNTPKWLQMFGNLHYEYPFNNMDDNEQRNWQNNGRQPVPPVALHPGSERAAIQTRQQVADAIKRSSPPCPLPVATPPTVDPSSPTTDLTSSLFLPSPTQRKSPHLTLNMPNQRETTADQRETSPNPSSISSFPPSSGSLTSPLTPSMPPTPTAPFPPDSTPSQHCSTRTHCSVTKWRDSNYWYNLAEIPAQNLFYNNGLYLILAAIL